MSDDTKDFQNYIKKQMRLVDKALDRFLPKATVAPVTIHKAMRYSLFAGGKRLRPVLVLAAAEAAGGSEAAALPAACAVECLHTYSLIHDDLPCMDNDDFRRGRPTSHKVFGEGIAVLAGDALLTLALDLVAQSPGNKRFSSAAFVRELAKAGGSRELIAGQVMDIEAEGKKITADHLRKIHQGKTAALIRSCLSLGGMSAGATPRVVEALGVFGFSLGLAFQIVDDILDITQTSEQLGKSAGKDVKAQKSTYPALMGLKGAEAEAEKWTWQAHDALKPLGKKATRLHQIADFLLVRQK
jgi:geranylgeranyl diphosphate synthase type II